MNPVRKLLIRHRFSVLLFAATEALEVLLGVLITLWGLWLLNPQFAAFSASKTFDTMNQIAPEELWGFVAVVIGLTQLLGLVREDRKSRMVGSFFAFLFWLFLTLLFIASNPQTTGIVTYSVISLSAGWVYLRLGWYLQVSVNQAVPGEAKNE